MFPTYIKTLPTALTLLWLSSCSEEFEVNSSYLSPVNNKTIVYKGEKAGDFKVASQHIDWKEVETLIVSGHINRKDFYIIRNATLKNKGNIKKLDFRNADILEGTFPQNAFINGKPQLESFVYPRKLMHTGNFVLNGISDMKEVIIPEEVEILGAGIFRDVSHPYLSKHAPMAEEKYAIPRMVRELGDGCLNYYPYPTIDLPESVEKLGVGCFKASKLTSFTIPLKVTILRGALFMECKDLKTVTIHDKVTEIEQHAFYDSGIEELIMPESITTVGKGFIGKAPRLKKIKWSSKITALPDEGLKELAMEEFHVPPAITSLGRHCFESAKTKKYYFHENITKIGEGLFNYSKEGGEPAKTLIEELHVKWQTPLPAGKAFQLSINFGMGGSRYYLSPDFTKVKLYVPTGTKALYEKAEGWKKFVTIIEE